MSTGALGSLTKTVDRFFGPGGTLDEETLEVVGAVDGEAVLAVSGAGGWGDFVALEEVVFEGLVVNLALIPRNGKRLSLDIYGLDFMFLYKFL